MWASTQSLGGDNSGHQPSHWASTQSPGGDSSGHQPSHQAVTLTAVVINPPYHLHTPLLLQVDLQVPSSDTPAPWNAPFPPPTGSSGSESVPTAKGLTSVSCLSLTKIMLLLSMAAFGPQKENVIQIHWLYSLFTVMTTFLSSK